MNGDNSAAIQEVQVMALPNRRSLVSRALINIGLLFFSMVLTLLVIEGGFRAMSALSKKQAVRSSRPSLYYLPSSAADMRGFAAGAPKAPDTFRIAVVGDSISFGPNLQFDDTYPKRLERLLNLDNPTPRVEVVNYGTPGFSTAHEVKLINQAIAQGADLILLQIYFNDPEIAPPSAQTPQFVQQFVFHPQWRILKYWQSLNYLMERIHNSSTHSAYIKYFFNLFDEPKTWNNFTSSIDTIKRITEERHVPIMAIVFPLMGFELDQSYPFHPLHHKVHQLLKEKKLRYLDLFKTYAGIPIETLHVIPGKDHHPNEVGHRLAAESIFQWLHTKKALPEQYFQSKVYMSREGIREKQIKDERQNKIANKRFLEDSESKSGPSKGS